jgi:perosamine synthetase
MNKFSFIINDFKKIYKKKKNPLHEPIFKKKDFESLNKCLKSTLVSTHGPCTLKFEKEICNYTGSKYAVCTSSGTAALHASLILSKIEENSEVLLPSLNFVASANAIRYCSAIPHFIDIDEESISVSPKYLKDYLDTHIKKEKFTYNKNTGRKITALILPHLFGVGANSKKILDVLKKFNIKLIEDAAEGLGVFIKKKHVGTTGKFGILSFNGNKIITTGGGGAILTQKYKDYLSAKKLVSLNKENHLWKYNYSSVGYNYKMPAINASLGISQITQIESIIKKKENNYKRIKEFFKNNKYFQVKDIPEGIKSNFWLINLIIKKKLDIKFLLKKLNENGIYARQAWCLLDNLNHFKKYPKSKLYNTKRLFKKMISLPSSANL